MLANITAPVLVELMPSLVRQRAVGGRLGLAGILVAAPFAAVMSSVDSFLLLVSSGVVRDIYQQNLKHEVLWPDNFHIALFLKFQPS